MPLLLAVIALLGACAHQSEARCAQRPPSPMHAPAGASSELRESYQRRQDLVVSIGETYEDGMRDFRAAKSHADNHGVSAFAGIYQELTFAGEGEFLYEQLADGGWAYRCDELTKLYALAAYRWGIVAADHEEPSDRDRLAKGHFCVALRSRPEIVLAVVKEEGLSGHPRAAFDAALRDPFCYRERGWYKGPSREPPRNTSPWGGW